VSFLQHQFIIILHYLSTLFSIITNLLLFFTFFTFWVEIYSISGWSQDAEE